MTVTNLNVFKMSKLTAQIIDILKREGAASLKDFGELPLQMGLGSEVLQHADCPDDTVIALRGRTVARYVELVTLSSASEPKTVKGIAATVTVGADVIVPPSIEGDLNLMYLAIPVHGEFDIDGLTEYTAEMIDAVREKLAADGYSVEEREALIGMSSNAQGVADEVHVYVDTEIFEDETFSSIVGEHFDEDTYEKLDAAEYDEKYQLPAMIAGLDEDTLVKLAEVLDIKAPRKGKLTALIVTAAVAKLDRKEVVAAVNELIEGESAEEGTETETADVVNELTAAQVKQLAHHLDIKTVGKKSAQLIETILAQDEADVIDALDALGFLGEEEEGEEQPEAGEDDVTDKVTALSTAELRTLAKALDVKFNRKDDDETLTAAIMEQPESDILENMAELGFIDADEEEETEEPADEEAEEGSDELEAKLEELDIDVIVNIAEELELNVGKKPNKAKLIASLLEEDAETVEAAIDTFSVEEGEEEPAEEGDTLELLYSYFEECKAKRGHATPRKELLESLAENDLTAAKRKDVVTLHQIGTMTEMDDETKALIEQLAGEDSALDETVLGYFTKIFANEIAGEFPAPAGEETKAPAKPAAKAPAKATAKPSGKGATTRKPAAKK